MHHTENSHEYTLSSISQEFVKISSWLIVCCFLLSSVLNGCLVVKEKDTEVGGQITLSAKVPESISEIHLLSRNGDAAVFLPYNFKPEVFPEKDTLSKIDIIGIATNTQENLLLVFSGYRQKLLFDSLISPIDWAKRSFSLRKSRSQETLERIGTFRPVTAGNASFGVYEYGLRGDSSEIFLRTKVGVFRSRAGFMYECTLIDKTGSKKSSSLDSLFFSILSGIEL